METTTKAEPLDELEVRQQMLEVCRRLYNRNMLAGADGNVSFRISDERILITPSGRPKAFLEIKDIAVMNIKGEIESGNPSAERSMHLSVYQSCPQVRSVIHAHPPTAIAWSVARPDLKELPADSLSEVILAIGRIPIVPYARPTTVQMGDRLKPFLPQNRVMILSRHGGLSWGESLEEAHNGMERLEHVSHILALAHSLGGLTSLPEEELKALRDMRARMGERIL